MKTHFLFTSISFSPTSGELDDTHDDFINPGLFALELADFLERELTQLGYPTRSRCQEDWGHWLELEHSGKFTLAVCCANTESTFADQPEHRVFLEPSKPVIRKLFKKIDVQDDVEKLAVTLIEIFKNSSEIENVRIEEAT